MKARTTVRNANAGHNNNTENVERYLHDLGAIGNQSEEIVTRNDVVEQVAYVGKVPQVLPRRFRAPPGTLLQHSSTVIQVYKPTGWKQKSPF